MNWHTSGGGLSASDRTKLNALSLKNNLGATVAPTNTDDSTKGYASGSIWVATGTAYACVSAEEGKAIWISSNDMFYFNTWAELTAAISVSGTNYIGKFCNVANANGGPSGGITYTAPVALSDYIVDGGSATFKVNMQGTNYSVTCQPRTITNPVVTSIMLTALAKPTARGYYIFTVTPTNGLQSNINLQDIAYYNGDSWILFQRYANAPNTVLIGTTTTAQEIWKKQSGTWINSNTSALANLIDALYPVGHIFMTKKAENPSTYLRVGTWVPYGAGRVPVGINTGDLDFNALGKTGGEKIHYLNINEIPSHNHNNGSFNRLMISNGISTVASNVDNSANEPNLGVAADILPAGGNQAHNNLQPYVVCYMWERTL